MYHRVPRNVDVLNIHQLDGAARCASSAAQDAGCVRSVASSTECRVPSTGWLDACTQGGPAHAAEASGELDACSQGRDSVHNRNVETFVGAIVAADNAALAEGNLGPRGSNGGSDRIDGDGHGGHKDVYHRVARNVDCSTSINWTEPPGAQDAGSISDSGAVVNVTVCT